jgi:aminoglycoside N3'-acetyltransferase
MTDDRLGRFEEVLERLAVPRGRVLYVQSSMDWVQRAGFQASAVMKALSAWTGHDGTLAMPSYPSAQPHVEYLASAPVFDVRKTPTISGLLAEMLRRTPGVARSLDPDFPVCVTGADADAIAGTLPLEADPFGPDSPYQRMLQRHAVLVGLGVSLNTSSFIHAVDSRAGDGYPSTVYDDRPFTATTIDREGRRHTIARRALRPAFQRLIAPSAVIDAMQPGPEALTTLELGGATFFRWDLDRWWSWCLSHARARAAEGRWPCWLTRLADAAS